MKLAWLTDIHLNFLEKAERGLFYEKIIDSRVDGVLISGDIAEAPSLISIMEEMADKVGKPIYFILGNHDYYRGSVEEMHNSLTSLTESNDKLFWLPASGFRHIGTNTILVGQDGWADGRLGDYKNSRVVLNDSRLIADLFQENILGKYQLLDKMQQLADKDAFELKMNLIDACHLSPKKIIVLTHVPPYRETCIHEGKISDDDWLPFFGSKVVGDVLMEIAQNNPCIDFLVLCGHTHSKAMFQPLDNLIVKTGEAEYYEPQVQEVISV
ncbi:MAG: metallophosphoesterase family protein [Gammaproteobacteria bacterium]